MNDSERIVLFAINKKARLYRRAFFIYKLLIKQETMKRNILFLTVLGTILFLASCVPANKLTAEQNKSKLIYPSSTSSFLSLSGSGFLSFGSGSLLGSGFTGSHYISIRILILGNAKINLQKRDSKYRNEI